MKKYFIISLLLMIFTVSFAEKAEKTTVAKAIETVTEVAEEGSNAVATVYGDSKSIVTTIYDDSKDIVTWATPKIEKAVSDLAKGLKVGTEEVFTILVMQQVVYSVVYTLVLLLCILLAFAFFKESNKIKSKPTEDDIATNTESTTKNVVLCCIYLTGVVITGIIFFTNIITFAMGYINPRYGAMMEIVGYAEKLIP